MVMNKRKGQRAGVRIAQFKAHMGRYLKEVRKGYSITLLDRDHPIAEIVPHTEVKGYRLTVRPATRKWGSIVLPPPLPPGSPDSLTILLEDRNRDRF